MSFKYLDIIFWAIWHANHLFMIKWCIVSDMTICKFCRPIKVGYCIFVGNELCWNFQFLINFSFDATMNNAFLKKVSIANDLIMCTIPDVLYSSIAQAMMPLIFTIVALCKQFYERKVHFLLQLIINSNFTLCLIFSCCPWLCLSELAYTFPMRF